MGFALLLLRLVVRLARFSVSVHVAQPGKALVSLAGVASFLSLPKLATAVKQLPAGKQGSRRKQLHENLFCRRYIGPPSARHLGREVKGHRSGAC